MVKKLIKPEKMTKKKWKKEEWEELERLVELNGEKWTEISKMINKRDAKQCMQKYFHMKKIKKKGRWSKEEDKTLMEWVNLHGAKKWSECAKKIKGRCGKQCRQRYNNSFQLKYKRGIWTEEEIEKFFYLFKEFKGKWTKISKKILTRSEASTKNRFYTCIKTLKTKKVILFMKSHLFENHLMPIQKDERPLREVFKELREEISKLSLFCLYIIKELLVENSISRYILSYFEDSNFRYKRHIKHSENIVNRIKKMIENKLKKNKNYKVANNETSESAIWNQYADKNLEKKEQKSQRTRIIKKITKIPEKSTNRENLKIIKEQKNKLQPLIQKILKQQKKGFKTIQEKIKEVDNKINSLTKNIETLSNKFSHYNFRETSFGPPPIFNSGYVYPININTSSHFPVNYNMYSDPVRVKLNSKEDFERSSIILNEDKTKKELVTRHCLRTRYW